MRKCRVWVKTALCALAVVAGGAGLVAAQEVSLSNLALKNTYLKVRSEQLELLWNSSWKNIFSPTVITCPGTSGTCTAQIEVSVEFDTGNSLDQDDIVVCRVIRGAIISSTVALPGVVRFIVTSDGTFTWIARGLPLGSSTIGVQCQLDSSSPPVSHIWATQRTLTIDVYKP